MDLQVNKPARRFYERQPRHPGAAEHQRLRARAHALRHVQANYRSAIRRLFAETTETGREP
ncbi:hypothetical protein [Streptomyces shenzhenensis]|uniref:Uncharacterized protein n=1 Tax=Streptomyces shenzhenensis TaxID=943815 RepID=A0A3M0IFJ5_9ACTN|nr:hypothetical protein [Streptomyces shenzhenensis]RMB87312.1 hypothetical protein CTZ28_05215 [Streptomyces shenzhenensis]